MSNFLAEDVVANDDDENLTTSTREAFAVVDAKVIRSLRGQVRNNDMKNYRTVVES